MEFTERIAGTAVAAAWGSAVAGGLAAVLTARYQPAASVSTVGAVAWTTFAVALAAVTTVMSRRGLRNPSRLRTRMLVARSVLVASVLGITGLSCATGGLLGCAWLLLALTVIFASLVFDRWSLAAFAALLAGCVVAIGALTATWTSATAPTGVLAALVLAGMTLLDGQLAQGIISLEGQSNRAREELAAGVSELTAQLERAAAGDLTPVPAMQAEDGEQGTVVVLSASVNAALGSLRTLVEQVRAGGEQIAASAGELLADAPRSTPRSATQQSSAVAETTSTIEELAATAAQIAETVRGGRAVRRRDAAARRGGPYRGQRLGRARWTRSPTGSTRSPRARCRWGRRARRSAASSRSSTTSPTRPTCSR